jgi:deoxyadenosine/deoxycytidine kinase
MPDTRSPIKWTICSTELNRNVNSAKVPIPALMDGGLDLDFYGFTRLFHTRGFLSSAEFDLCYRFYSFTRSLLPPPDLVIALSADAHIISQRLASRNRINIASNEDADLLEGYVNKWLESLPESKILKLNVSQENSEYSYSVPLILDRIK